MNSIIISASKKRSELNKKYYKDTSYKNKELVHAHSNVCSKMIIRAIEKHVNKISKKRDDPKTSSKCYWLIVNSFLSNIKIPKI